MRFNRPTTTPAGDSGGGSSVPSWRAKWLKEQVRWVELECGHLQDLSIPVLTFIYSFKGCEVDCVPCDRFRKVKRTLKPRKVTMPDEPLF